jgi:hypothetical protein
VFRLRPSFGLLLAVFGPFFVIFVAFFMVHLSFVRGPFIVRLSRSRHLCVVYGSATSVYLCPLWVCHSRIYGFVDGSHRSLFMVRATYQSGSGSTYGSGSDEVGVPLVSGSWIYGSRAGNGWYFRGVWSLFIGYVRGGDVEEVGVREARIDSGTEPKVRTPRRSESNGHRRLHRDDSKPVRPRSGRAGFGSARWGWRVAVRLIAARNA